MAIAAGFIRGNQVPGLPFLIFYSEVPAETGKELGHHRALYLLEDEADIFAILDSASGWLAPNLHTIFCNAWQGSAGGPLIDK